jgi:hypothetical protein
MAKETKCAKTKCAYVAFNKVLEKKKEFEKVDAEYIRPRCEEIGFRHLWKGATQTMRKKYGIIDCKQYGIQCADCEAETNWAYWYHPNVRVCINCGKAEVFNKKWTEIKLEVV